MTIFATFEATEGREWAYRLVVTGTFDVYVQRVSGYPETRRVALRDRIVHTFGNALVSTWNSMSEPCEVRGTRYMVHFELRAQQGSSRRIEGLLDRLDPERPHRHRSELWDMHTQLTMDSTNAVFVFPRRASPADGRVPPVSAAHRALATHLHQPWSALMLLGPSASEYTMMHEVGHVLGLGEGYRLYITRREIRPGYSVLASATDRTIPEDAGTPMAMPREAGRDANQEQLQAIVGYAEAALARGGGGSHYGREVDHYRARRRTS